MIPQVIPQIKVIPWQYYSCWQSTMSSSGHIYKTQKKTLYTSITIQNEVIQLIGNHITDNILKGFTRKGVLFFHIR